MAPTAATEFSGNNSVTSVTLKGYVLTDGGSAISASGIVWAVFHNPTINDNLANRETGTTEAFTVTLTGLTEGKTYYARTYATNSAGTAYGNCIRFIATNPAGIDENKIKSHNMTIYPNPASASATVRFLVNSSESVVITMIDMKGQVVLNYELGRLPLGESQVELKLSDFQNGTYVCQLINGKIKTIGILVIAH